MDPLNSLRHEELLRFFHCNKTVMSCMENPHTFLSQLRDYDLIPEDRYKKLSHVKSKEALSKGLYQTLDWLEQERPQWIHIFWRCVFEETIRNQYPTLRQLHNSLMDGSSYFYTPLPEKVEKEQRNQNKMKGPSGEEDEEENNPSSAKKKKRKPRSRSVLDDGDDEEQPGPSSQRTPGQTKKTKKICFSSPLKKGQKGDIWTWAIFQSQLPVTCGDLEGSLNRARLAQGEKCILFQKRWLAPSEFMKRAGRQSCKNWKLSIRCNGTPLGRLMQEGHLKSVRHKGGRSTVQTKSESVVVKKLQFPSDDVITDGEDESEDEEGGDEDEDDQVKDQEAQASAGHRESSPADVPDEPTGQRRAAPGGTRTLAVTCGALTGTLHKSRFASGTRGKSIRTETSWMSPEEFAKEASCQTDVSWRKDIKCEDQPLGVLTQQDVLRVHTLLCTCRLCTPDRDELESQKNDDECFVCRAEVGPELVVCDECPRAFHQRCHLPHVRDAILRDSRPWICTFCVFKANREWRYSDELETQEVLSHQISRHMLECQHLLLSLCHADEEQMFALNPTVYVPGYSAVIQRPMWFDEIANKLQNSRYQTVGEFVSDVQLVFSNCAKYNRDNPEFLETGSRLKKLFDDEFKDVFSIHDS